jgi:hypothetical protein
LRWFRISTPAIAIDIIDYPFQITNVVFEHTSDVIDGVPNTQPKGWRYRRYQ